MYLTAQGVDSGREGCLGKRARAPPKAGVRPATTSRRRRRARAAPAVARTLVRSTSGAR